MTEHATTVLAEELEVYAASKAELLAESEGKFVLIHDSEILGAYETEADAITEGYRRVGNVPFLVKQVLAVEIPERYVSNLIAL